MLKIVYCLWALVLVVGVRADTPANCTYEDIRGVWVFSESERSAERTEKCDGTQKLVNKVKIELQYPNTAVDQFGNKGAQKI
jgi:cathepsin C